MVSSSFLVIRLVAWNRNPLNLILEVGIKASTRPSDSDLIQFNNDSLSTFIAWKTLSGQERL
jgi:hypothetical protein